jgi:hypothetical protein
MPTEAHGPNGQVAGVAGRLLATLDEVDAATAQEAHGLDYASLKLHIVRAREVVEDLLAEVGRVRGDAARVVCIGRTKAGKSTLRFVLTGEGAEGIGKGGQRTTSVPITYRWRGIDIVDTPGVGAYKGAVDDASALAATADADLVVWVAGSDSQQPATVAPVLQAIAPGIPVHVVVNHKQAFTTDELAGDLAPTVIFSDITGQETRIRTVLARVDAGATTIVHVNLWLAQRGLETGNQRLLDQSGLPAAENALAIAASEAHARRPATVANVISARAAAAAAATRVVAETLEALKTELQVERQRLREDADGAAAEYLQSVAREAANAFASARTRIAAAARVAATEPHRGKAGEHLRSEADLANKEAHASFRKAAQAAAERSSQPLIDGYGLDPLVARVRIKAPQLTHHDLKGDPLNARAVNWVARGLKGAAAVAAITLTEGWATPLVIGLLSERTVDVTRKNLAPTVKRELAEREESVDAAQRGYTTAMARAGERAEEKSRQAWGTVAHHLNAVLADRACQIENYARWRAQLTRLSSELADGSLPGRTRG